MCNHISMHACHTGKFVYLAYCNKYLYNEPSGLENYLVISTSLIIYSLLQYLINPEGYFSSFDQIIIIQIEGYCIS